MEQGCRNNHFIVIHHLFHQLWCVCVNVPSSMQRTVHVASRVSLWAPWGVGGRWPWATCYPWAALWHPAGVWGYLSGGKPSRCCSRWKPSLRLFANPMARGPKWHPGKLETGHADSRDFCVLARNRGNVNHQTLNAVWLAVNKQRCSREGKGRRPPLGSPAVGATLGYSPGSVTGMLTSCSWLEWCSAEQLRFLPVVLGCHNMCSSL